MLVIERVEVSDYNGGARGAFEGIPQPSSYKWTKQDLSGEDAGRTMTSDMWKNLIARAVTLDLTWTNRTAEESKTILQAFNHEYVWITYVDPMLGESARKHFYIGDMSADMYNATLYGGLYSVIKFKCIQAKTDKTGGGL